MSRYRHVEDEDQYEDVAQFIVNLNWGPEYNYNNDSITQGLQCARIVIEGVATSTQAIERAKELLLSVRVDEPRETKVELKTSKRLKPRQIESGEVIDA
jgi:hypothetical protein